MSETNGTKATQSDRRLYKIIRGSYSRREGFEKPHIDPETKRPTRRKSQPFAHYAARTTRNPDARDEVYMTDPEARAFGRHNLRELYRGNVQTDTVIDVDELLKRELPTEDKHRVVEMLLEEGQLIKKRRQLDTWRDRVFQSELFDKELPNKRLEIVEWLQRVEV